MTTQNNLYITRYLPAYTCRSPGSNKSSHIQAGIGTYTIPQIAKPMMAKVHKALDAMIGIHLNAHVMSKSKCRQTLVFMADAPPPGGYEFLMQNCEDLLIL